VKHVNLSLPPFTGSQERVAQREVARFGIVDAHDDDVGSIGRLHECLRATHGTIRKPVRRDEFERGCR
jgi:hypothetical protein